MESQTIQKDSIIPKKDETFVEKIEVIRCKTCGHKIGKKKLKAYLKEQS